ncbi:glycosyltransferase family 4 protein [Vibrio furnissii]|uniref:glycosyltransferase family 4 protein n=1 Tax=Vibrio furnissii TaxID=29494 RepID=UPI001302CEDA|nr:glycosyltransferase family 4 protein [Vibrio furnissii]
MLNIAYCVTSLANKGPVIVIRDIVNNISKECDITIFYIDNIVEVDFPTSVKLVKLDSALQKYDFSEFDIVHSHLFRADLLCFKNKSTINHWVSTIHADIFGEFRSSYGLVKGFFYSRLWIKILKSADVQVSLSNYHYKLYKKYFDSNVIYNGRPFVGKSEIDNRLSSIRADNIGKTMLGSCAHVVKRKGFDQVLNVLAKDDSNQFYFVLVGDGPEIFSLKNMARQLGVEDKCYFLGVTNNVNKFFPYFDLFIMTSSSEGMPLALIEAASHGKAAVVSDIPMLKEVFSSKEVVFYEHGKVDSLYDSIKNALKNKSKLEANILIKYNENYSDIIMSDRYMKLYEEVDFN